MYSGCINGQNLVPNHSFEEFEKCPSNFTVNYRNELVPGWYIPSLGTPDYFNSCTRNQVGVPQNFMGYCLPQEGLAYAGIIVLLEPPIVPTKDKLINYREYLQTRLTKGLEKDKVYEIKFYYFIASYSTFAINRLGVYISHKKVQNILTSGVLNFRPQISIDSTVVKIDSDTWFVFSVHYKAQGGEKYITIGNFYDDNKTQYELCDHTGLSSIKRSMILSEQIAYYYIDNVSVKVLK